MLSTVSTILTALSAVKGLYDIISSFSQSVAIWYIQSMSKQALTAVSDAAAMQARATNQAERYAALDSWAKALSMPRIKQ